MLIKIKEKGWESYSEDLGTVPFKDGVSTRDVSTREALSLGAFLMVVEIDAEGNELGQVSPALDVLRSTKITSQPQAGLVRVSQLSAAGPAVEQYGAVLDDDPILAARASQNANEAAGRTAADAPPPEAAAKHTAESLEKLASEKGIAGLREVAAPFGVKNTSVKGLMTEILAAQDKAG